MCHSVDRELVLFREPRQRRLLPVQRATEVFDVSKCGHFGAPTTVWGESGAARGWWKTVGMKPAVATLTALLLYLEAYYASVEPIVDA